MSTTVALIDDDASMLTGLERLLQASGYLTRTFESAEQFLDQGCYEAACLIVDINLGGMSGIELQRHLAAAGSSLPVILISGADDRMTKAAALDTGCVAFFQKPVAVQLLVGAIRKAEGLA